MGQSIPWTETAYVLAGLFVLLLLNRFVHTIVTRIQRQRMIDDNDCKLPYQYPHQGFLGKLLGLDVIKLLVQTGKEGRLLEASRLRNFSNGRSTLQLNVMRRNFVMTIEPENVKTILSTKFTDYSLGERRKAAFLPLFGPGIFATDGHAWERSRALIRPNFVRAQVADLDMFEKHMQHLIDNVPRDGSTVDLQTLFFGLTIDSATEFLFGVSTDSLLPGVRKKSSEDFVEAFVYACDAVAVRFRTAGLTKFIPDAKWRRSIRVIHKFADDIIADAIRQQKSGDLEKSGIEVDKPRYVFLNELLKQTQDPYTVRSELLNVLLAGRDTTAGLLSNTWHVLARRPDIFAKLKAEIDATVGKERPEYATIKDMKYLKYVLNESLRLMPVVPGNNREAIRDTILPVGGGPDQKSPVFIPKGTLVNYSPWSMHRRTDYFGPDALEFKPERWESLRPGWEYLPFNGGPRICIGQQYALMEASYATIRLIQAFPRLENRDPRPWRESVLITLSSGHGTQVALYAK